MSDAEYSPAAPTRRDTVVTYPGVGAAYLGNQTIKLANQTIGGYIKLRLNATDPGAWIVHCHLTVRGSAKPAPRLADLHQPHLIMGMGAIFFVGSENLPPLPESLEAEYMYVRHQVSEKLC